MLVLLQNVHNITNLNGNCFNIIPKAIWFHFSGSPFSVAQPLPKCKQMGPRGSHQKVLRGRPRGGQRRHRRHQRTQDTPRTPPLARRGISCRGGRLWSWRPGLQTGRDCRGSPRPSSDPGGLTITTNGYDGSIDFFRRRRGRRHRQG